MLEAAREAELPEHPGHDHGQTPIAANMRNETRVMTVLSEIGPVEIEVPFGQDGTLTPVIAPQRKRHLDRIDQIVLYVLGQRIDHGEIAAHFEEICRAKLSQDTLNRITSESRRRTGRMVLSSAGPALSGALRRRDRWC